MVAFIFLRGKDGELKEVRIPEGGLSELNLKFLAARPGQNKEQGNS